MNKEAFRIQFIQFVSEKLTEVFEYLSRYNRELKKMFKEEKSETNRKRVQLLLDYLARHVQRYEKAMRQAAGKNNPVRRQQQKYKKSY